MKIDPNQKIGDLDFDLSVRALNVLKTLRVETVGELAALNEKELRNVRNCGARTVEELSSLLKSASMKFSAPVSAAQALEGIIDFRRVPVLSEPAEALEFVRLSLEQQILTAQKSLLGAMR